FAAPPSGRGGGGGGGRGAVAIPGSLTFLDDERAVQFGASGFLWKCTLTDYVCTKGEAIAQNPVAGRGGAPRADDSLLAAPEMEGGDPVDGLEYQFPQQGGAGPGAPGRGPAGCAPRVEPVPPRQG